MAYEIGFENCALQVYWFDIFLLNYIMSLSFLIKQIRALH